MLRMVLKKGHSITTFSQNDQNLDLPHPLDNPILVRAFKILQSTSFPLLKNNRKSSDFIPSSHVLISTCKCKDLALVIYTRDLGCLLTFSGL